ncbi:conserved hypothetical protein [Ricinus communis]|uniref:Uncharacterized protein n=1 Tax=Ricinus communis TaxID=3988 RepID=B9S5J9_RICCO|nr:conserved hypothetical protein [Ricinus communis]
MASQDITFKKLDAKIDQIVQTNQAVIHNLELQVEQLAKKIAERGQGRLPNDTKVITKETFMAITYHFNLWLRRRR